jgi:hypothetical protein
MLLSAYLRTKATERTNDGNGRRCERQQQQPAEKRRQDQRSNLSISCMYDETQTAAKNNNKKQLRRRKIHVYSYDFIPLH